MSYLNKNHRIYPHFNNGRFYNHPNEKKPPFLLSPLSMLIEWYLCRDYQKDFDLSNWIDNTPPIKSSEKLAITWIGHSTFLIQVGGFNILTDPIFGDLFPLFRRFIAPGIEIKNLPKIDFVIISHNHPDHMNAYALKYLKNYNNPNVKYLVPLKDKKWFDRRSFNSLNVYECTWWQTLKFDNLSVNNDILNEILSEIEFTFLPAFHWSQRGLFDYNKSLWGSWMIHFKDTNIYFAGDTAYSKHFECISKEFDQIDIALMPIGPCEPHDWMKESHVDAEEAGQAFIDLKAKNFIPMHWGTYFFGIDNFHLPHDRLINWWRRQDFTQNELLHILKFGQRKYIDSNSIIIDSYKEIGLTI